MDKSTSMLIVLIVILIPLLYIIIKRKKAMNKVFSEIERNPNKQETARVLISRTKLPGSYEEYPKEKNIIYLELGLLVVIFIMFIIILRDNITTPTIAICLIPIVVLIFILIYTKTNYTKDTIKYLDNELRKKYFDVSPKKSLKKNIVSGSNRKVGSIRESEIYVCSVKKFNCLLRTYYEEVLINERITYDTITPLYTFKKRHKYISYDYDLSNTKIKDININDEKFINKTKELAKTKVIKSITYSNNHLVVTKETVFNGYQERDAIVDSNDVEFFYKELVDYFK